MKNQTPAFDADHAAQYDKSFAKLAPFKEAMHILIRSALAGLPESANVLCVGAGTGAELLFLAAEFPGWTFTALDLSKPMLDVLSQRADASGMADRIRIHVGPVDSLPGDEHYDAATAILVSQFLRDRDARIAFFRAIHERLVAGGVMVSADLAGDLAAPTETPLLSLWRRVLAFNGLNDAKIEGNIEAFRSHVAVVPEGEVTEVIVAGGFARPERIFQTGLIHGWMAQRDASAP